jgi:arabinogalactan endo-1,4-beta-galactosidase
VAFVLGMSSAACGTETPQPPASTGGTPATGGQPSGGTVVATGGTPVATGGTSTGGVPAGGTATGGTATGGKATGGTSAGGTATGGKATGGATAAGGSQGTGGSAGNCPAPNPNLFAIGMDLSGRALTASTLNTYKSHGINYVRLRTFVDPKAADGYDKTNGNCDLAHTIQYGKVVKDACMGLLVDFHYSDNWADPGKQCVPVPWQGYTTITDMANAVYDYTKNVITQMIAGGARPDMVQIGNEETPGILIHLCDSGGQPLAGIAGYNAVNGALYFWSVTDQGAPPSSSTIKPGGWTNLGKLLNAASRGVKDVDAGILVSLHLDRGNQLSNSQSYITSAKNQSVPFDAFGESCYTNTQGQPSDWQNTFTSLASSFPTLKLFIAEYSDNQKPANDIIFNLPNNLGVGTFCFTPNTSASTMAIYDQMKIDYASRL